MRTDRAALGDFTATPRMLLVSLVAVVIGAASSFVALALLELINLFTDSFFFHDVSFVAGRRGDRWTHPVARAHARR